MTNFEPFQVSGQNLSIGSMNALHTLRTAPFFLRAFGRRNPELPRGCTKVGVSALFKRLDSILLFWLSSSSSPLVVILVSSWDDSSGMEYNREEKACMMEDGSFVMCFQVFAHLGVLKKTFKSHRIRIPYHHARPVHYFVRGRCSLYSVALIKNPVTGRKQYHTSYHARATIVPSRE